jgi:hypothetical protein
MDPGSFDFTIPEKVLEEKEKEKKPVGRPRKNSGDPPPLVSPHSPKKGASPLTDALSKDEEEVMKVKIMFKLNHYKTAPCFKDRFKNITVDEKQSLVVLKEKLKLIQDEIAATFQRKAVDQMFIRGVEAVEGLMVNVMNLEYLQGASKEIVDNKKDFDEELTEIAIEFAEYFPKDPLYRLVFKVANAFTEVSERRAFDIKMKKIDGYEHSKGSVKFKDD